MSNYTVERLARNDPRVTSVNVTPDDFSRVAAALQGNTHVHDVFVRIGAAGRRNELPADDVQADWNEFCRAAQALPSLKNVWFHMRSEEPSEEDWILVGLLLEHTKQIKKLFLLCCYDNGSTRSTFPSTAACRLARNLTELAGLEELYFDNFQIQPTDLAPLLSALSSLPILKRLNMRSQLQRAPLIVASLLDDAFVGLERLLRKQSLVYFCCANVAFSDAQADAIADIMSRRFDILDVRFNHIAATQSEASKNLNKKIQVIAKLNKAGRRYLAEPGPECKAAGINVLSVVSDDLDCLYYHLRENPALMSDLVGKSPNKKRKR